MSEETQTLDVIKPKGFKLLIALPAKKEKSDGGVYIPDGTQDREATAGMTGLVVGMGSLAYKDKEKFPEGAWCEVGDWVMFASFSGRKFKIKGQDLRLIHDDTVDAVVSDPRLIERAI